jgi:hypothetical protein
MSEDEGVRADPKQLLREWQSQGVPPRKYALLVARCYASYFRREDRALLRWVVQSADGPLTGEEWAAAIACADELGRQMKEGAQTFQVKQINGRSVGGGSMDYPVRCLRTALTDPEQAASDVLDWEENTALVVELMECLRPPHWQRPARGWVPPTDAVEWARRIYKTSAFDELPILADRLEDADCPDRPLLDHCRNHGCHCWGCAALDRILRVERSESRPQLWLAGRTGCEGAMRFSASFTVGRGPDVDAVLSSFSLSRRHAAVSYCGDGWRVADLCSSNGTRLNGIEVGTEPSGPLRRGDIVQFGDLDVRVVYAAPGDLPPASG